MGSELDQQNRRIDSTGAHAENTHDDLRNVQRGASPARIFTSDWLGHVKQHFTLNSYLCPYSVWLYLVSVSPIF